MNNPTSDIELIRQYFNGELDASAKHLLEERALNDPFLQDVMDGFDSGNIDEASLLELQERLTNRLNRKEETLGIAWGLKQWGIAASIIFGIAIISIYFNQTPENKAITVSDLQKKEGYPKSLKIEDDTLKLPKNNSSSDLIDSNPAIISYKEKELDHKNAYTPAEEIVVESATQSAISKSTTDSVALNELSAIAYQNKKINYDNLNSTKLYAENRNPVLSSKMLNTGLTKSILIKGKVIDVNSGNALPGVQITNQQNSSVTLSNSKGEFNILVTDKTSLAVSYFGYQPQNVVVNTKDSLNIGLKPDEIVTPKASSNIYDNDRTVDILAGPQDGWPAFRKYLDASAKLKDEKKARVVIEFLILPNGQLSEFKILKGENLEANNKAIKLVKDYLGWHGAVDGLPQKARVVIRFK